MMKFHGWLGFCSDFVKGSMNGVKVTNEIVSVTYFKNSKNIHYKTKPDD